MSFLNWFRKRAEKKPKEILSPRYKTNVKKKEKDLKKIYKKQRRKYSKISEDKNAIVGDLIEFKLINFEERTIRTSCVNRRIISHCNFVELIIYFTTVREDPKGANDSDRNRTQQKRMRIHERVAHLIIVIYKSLRHSMDPWILSSSLRFRKNKTFDEVEEF